MTKLTEHFALEEMIRSDYGSRNGIDNTPSQEITNNLISLCEHVLEPLREIVKKPIHIQSGYRSPEINAGIGGAKTSQHLIGQAADIIVDGMTVTELFNLASKYVPFDQLIYEFGEWVHVSYNAENNRRQQFLASHENGKTIYTSITGTI